MVFLTESDRKRILITGGAGFVGSHLVDILLKEGHEVSKQYGYVCGSCAESGCLFLLCFGLFVTQIFGM